MKITTKTTGMFAAALLGVLTVLAVTPTLAQSGPPKPSKEERQAMTKSQRAERKAQRKMEKKDAQMGNNMNQMGQRNSPGMMGNSGTMAGDNMAPTMMNNTAAGQGNIDRANKTLSDMVALLDQIEARKRGGGTTTGGAQ